MVLLEMQMMKQLKNTLKNKADSYNRLKISYLSQPKLCKICNTPFNTWHELTQHLRYMHKISTKDYYDTYIKDVNGGICKICQNTTKFISISKGYRHYCSLKCKSSDDSLKEKSRYTSLAKYGATHYSKTEQWINSVKDTNNKKFGTDFAGQSEAVRKKMKQTCNKKYGTDTYSQTNECKEKVKYTVHSRYGVDYLMQSNVFKEKSVETCNNKYNVNNVSQCKEIQDKKINTNNAKYGIDWYNNPEKTKKTCLEKYGVSNYTKTDEYTVKTKQTNMSKYGKEYYSQTSAWNESYCQTCLEKYGNNYPAQNHDVRVKSQQKYMYNMKSFDSSWELAYYIWLKEHNINFKYQPNILFEYEYEMNKHVYHPDFQVNDELFEIKGPQFFKDGKMINPYDSSQNDLYDAKYRCMLTNNVKIIQDCSEYIDYINKKYGYDYINKFKKTNIDEIYKSLGEFPYITYNNLTLDAPYNIIQHYHKSIWHAHIANKMSPADAWLNKDIIYKVISNRLLYQNPPYTADKIRQGLTITKLAPKVSVFKPSIGIELIRTFLDDYSEFFDPFSGFSGRMLACAICNKQYIGQDINEQHVIESNNIITDFKLQNISVKRKDIFETEGFYECLFTCPPYNLKEIWNKDEINLSCDEWIDECIKRYKCKKYLFVVDFTKKYKNNIVKTLQNRSHFGINNEYVILI